jgi:hypothetical protein
MSRKVSLLLLFLAYALVLVHSFMPHEHLHQEITATMQHSHDRHPHSHEEERSAATDTENPFSHYFHSLAQGEPHFSGREDSSLSEASKEAIVIEQFVDLDHVNLYTVLTCAVHKADFHSPPHSHTSSQRGPPVA